MEQALDLCTLPAAILQVRASLESSCVLIMLTTAERKNLQTQQQQYPDRQLDRLNCGDIRELSSD
jgi:hypothetical protein